MRSSHIALLVSTSFALAAEDSPQQSISKAQAELAAFRQTKSPAALVSAYRSAQNIPELREHENWEVHRGKKLEVLLSVLKETDQAIDPKFDPERRPLRRPLFPAGALFELNSVTSPSSIQDPKLRY